MPIKIEINIEVESRDAAYDVIVDIASAITFGHFSALCTKDDQQYYGGTIFITGGDKQPCKDT